MGFRGGSVVKNLYANAGDMGLIPGSGRSPEERNGTHSNILVWETSWTEEPAGYSPLGHRVGHDFVTEQQQNPQRYLAPSFSSLVDVQVPANWQNKQTKKPENV